MPVVPYRGIARKGGDMATAERNLHFQRTPGMGPGGGALKLDGVIAEVE